MKINPASTAIALYYTGDESGNPHISGIPARDLTENDIAWLIGREHGELHGAAFEKAADKLADELTAGPYRRTAEPKPAKASKPKAAPVPVGAPPPEPTSVPEPVTHPIEPAAPAAEPEG